MNKTLLWIGCGLIIVALLWPWIKALPLGKLPGDLLFKKGNVRLYFPLTTSLIISVVLSLLLWFFRK